MTSDGEALFRAICELPWEDTPRLAYADWLDENGDPERAAYIRFQVACARLDPAVLRTYHCTQTEFAQHTERWHKELPVLPGVNWGAGWERGFVVSVWFDSAKAFRGHAPAVFAASPVSTVEVQRMTAQTLPGVLESPYLRRIEWFQPRGQIGDDGVCQIACYANLCNLKNLILSDVGMTDAGLEALARATVFDRLRILDFGSNQVTDRGVYALLDSITLNELKQISWYTNPVSAAAVGALRQRYHDSYTGTPPI